MAHIRFDESENMSSFKDEVAVIRVFDAELGVNRTVCQSVVSSAALDVECQVVLISSNFNLEGYSLEHQRRRSGPIDQV